MPLDNNGALFQYISITTLEATSEAIVQPLSRRFGYNRRLVYPMPHPYGAIGEARPVDNFVINTGPRPGAPIKPRVRNRMDNAHTQDTDQARDAFGEEDSSDQATASHGHDCAEERESDTSEYFSAREDVSPVRSPNTDDREDQPVTVPAEDNEKEAETEEAQPGTEERDEVGGRSRPVSGSLATAVAVSEACSEEDIREDSDSDSLQGPTLDVSSKPRIDFVPTTNTSPTVRLPPPQPETTLLAGTTVLSENQPDPPIHAQCLPPTDRGIPDFLILKNTNIPTEPQRPRVILRRPTVSFPPISAEMDRLQRMVKLKEATARRKKRDAEQDAIDRRIREVTDFHTILRRRRKRDAEERVHP